MRNANDAISFELGWKEKGWRNLENVMRERKLSKLLPGDLISRISTRERRVSQGF